MSDVLYHPLGPLPWALASADESLRKTNKALLAKEPQRNLTAADVILQPCAIVFNGMAMVHKVKGDQKTFAEMADSLMEMVLHEGTDSVLTWSLMFTATEKEGSETSHKFRNIKADHKIHQWRKFLSSANNKSLLIKFISEDWQNDRRRESLAGKTVFETSHFN